MKKSPKTRMQKAEAELSRAALTFAAHLDQLSANPDTALLDRSHYESLAREVRAKLETAPGARGTIHDPSVRATWLWHMAKAYEYSIAMHGYRAHTTDRGAAMAKPKPATPAPPERKDPPKPCSHCGARAPREEPIEVPAEQPIAAGDWTDAPIGIVTANMLRAMAKTSRVVTVSHG